MPFENQLHCQEQLLLEKETDKGRIDAVLELPDKVYSIEFKFSTDKRTKGIATLTQKALKQISEKKYYEAYLGAIEVLGDFQEIFEIVWSGNRTSSVKEG